MSAARWCLLAVLVTGCGSPRRALVSDDAATIDPALRPRIAAFEPAFDALSAALADGDEAAARAILARVRALRPVGPALEVADAFERILDGRAAARALELRLLVRGGAPANVTPGAPRADGPRKPRRLALAAVSSHPTAVKLYASAARLESSLFGVDVRGFEHRSAHTRSIDQLGELELSPDDPELLDVAEFDVPFSNELAVRSRFELVLVQPEIEIDGRRLPLSTLVVAPCEVDVLAPFLPTAAVEPAELARYLERPGFGLPAALERAVRIAPDRRDEALDLVAPVLARMNRMDLERATPCLRWLSGDRERGANPDSWRAWALERSRANQPTPELDLPTVGRDTAPPSGS
ncbi:MAG: hypothetical protein L6Q99_07780 [Planctomycetes bacterium]|nr:hypothetical protein [Planctomycetota bacterium]